MPLIKYVCVCKRQVSRMFKRRSQSPLVITCDECKGLMTRALSGPSLASVVTVDNGIQAKAVEVNLEIVESNKENSKKDFREK